MTGNPAPVNRGNALSAFPPRADPNGQYRTSIVNETEGAIFHALSLLREPGEIVEFRAFDINGARGTLSGYFDDPAKFAAAIAKFDGKGNLYMTLNPCHPALLSRAANRIQHNAKTTTADGDILRRRWILIDIDPTRPSGTASSDPQHEASLDRGREICAFLTVRGVRSVIFADSGNGAHILIRVDLPNDDQSTALVKSVLETLAAIFSRDGIDIDRKVFNASRIVKIYGTVACKGDPLPDYPHRRSCLLDVPEIIEITPRDVLENIAATAPALKTASTRTETFDIETWVQTHGVGIRKTGTMNGYSKWSIDCPWNSDHKGDAFIGQRSSGAIVAGCSHNSCNGKTWTDLRQFYEPDAYAKTRAARAPAEPAAVGPSGAMSAAREAIAERARRKPVLDAAALHGLAGRFVRLIEPHTESASVAILVQFLVCFGNAIGRSAHWRVEASRHYANTYACLVGLSSKGRKGTSLDHVRRVFAYADPDWSSMCVTGGLSSGEGLIAAVRDEVTKKEKDKKTGITSEVVVDAGVSDKRLLCTETEFAGPLRQAARDGNILSVVIRQAWDSGDIRTLTKNSPTRATGAHISIIGHITDSELRETLTATDTSNGFANRFLWICTERSKLLPFGGTLRESDLCPVIEALQEAITAARTAGLVELDREARAVWAALYPILSEGRPGLAGSVTSRAEAQTMRLALLYALLDQSDVIRADHLAAGLAVWQYADGSARYIFGNAIGNADADAILAMLTEAASDGLTRTQINDRFKGHRQTEKITAALSILENLGLARMEKIPTGGRAVEQWYTALDAEDAEKAD